MTGGSRLRAARPAPARPATARPVPARGAAQLPLAWVLGAGLLLLLAGAALEVRRARRDPIPAGLAPPDVSNQR